MGVHQITIGEIECAVLHEGGAAMDRDSVSARYPKVDPAAVAAALGDDPPAGSLNLLTINSGGTRILADVGFGETGPPGMGGALRGLASLGLSPADIDLVYLTHFHGDHIAGLVDAAGALAYPKARYATTRAEWDEWMGRWAAADDEQNLARFRGLRDRFSFVSAGDEIAPGVSVIDLEGHTLGQSGLLLESRRERLLHVVDLLHQPFQFEHVSWHFGFDSDGALAEATRRRVLQRCADEGLLTLFYHLPFPGLGRVKQAGAAFAFEPIR